MVLWIALKERLFVKHCPYRFTVKLHKGFLRLDAAEKDPVGVCGERRQPPT